MVGENENKRAMAEDFVAATCVFSSHIFGLTNGGSTKYVAKCTTQIFEFGANYFMNEARLACSITIAPRVCGRPDRLPNVAG
jgi:hypothetical protein